MRRGCYAGCRRHCSGGCTRCAPAAAPKEAAKKEAAKEARRPRRRQAPRSIRTPSIPKYSKETAGKARMHTCVDQYNANKATNGNGGMKWIQKGGGYYSECSKKLKGAA